VVDFINKQVDVLLLFVDDKVSSRVEICQCNSSIFSIKYNMTLVVLINNKIQSPYYWQSIMKLI